MDGLREKCRRGRGTAEIRFQIVRRSRALIVRAVLGFHSTPPLCVLAEPPEGDSTSPPSGFGLSVQRKEDYQG